MKGLTPDKRKVIESTVEELFNKLVHGFVGVKPKSKKMIFTTKTPDETLAHLYVKGLQNKTPSRMKKNIAKNMLKTTMGYITSLRDKTKSNVVDKIDSLIKESQMSGEDIDVIKISEALDAEMGKAKRHFKTIAETEATKIRNTSVAMNIMDVSASIGVDDPTVFFVVVRDGSTCKWCIDNHLLPDKVTPKVFKMSEVKTSYLSKEERENGSVSLSGAHPHCRCSLVICNPGFGFKGGKIAWIGLGHDEYKKQRED